MTNEKHRSSDLHLALRSKDDDNIRCRLLVREADAGVCLRLDVMNEDRLLAQKGAVVPTRDRHRLVDVVLVLIPRSAGGLYKYREVFTFGFTSSITDCFRLSRLIAFLAGVRAITLSSLSLYPPSAANSSAFENLT